MKWTDEEIEVLCRLYPTYTTAREIAEMLGRNESQVHGKARALGLHAPKDIQSVAGRKGANDPRAIATRWKKGHESPNKGKPMPPEVYEKVRHSFYKKGHAPHNQLPIGAEVVDTEGYHRIKIADPDIWEFKHRYMWKQEHGEIPDGYMVVFVNGNKDDLRIDNLTLMTKAELFQERNNMYVRYPEELVEVMRLKGILTKTINKHKKKDGK